MTGAGLNSIRPIGNKPFSEKNRWLNLRSTLKSENSLYLPRLSTVWATSSTREYFLTPIERTSRGSSPNHVLFISRATCPTASRMGSAFSRSSMALPLPCA